MAGVYRSPRGQSYTRRVGDRHGTHTNTPRAVRRMLTKNNKSLGIHHLRRTKQHRLVGIAGAHNYNRRTEQVGKQMQQRLVAVVVDLSSTVEKLYDGAAHKRCAAHTQIVLDAVEQQHKEPRPRQHDARGSRRAHTHTLGLP